MKISFCILICFFLYLNNTSGQETRYPQKIMPGDSFTVTSENDTLWLINNRQLNNTIITAKKLELCDSSNELQKKQISLLKLKCTELDSSVSILREGYDHYKILWTKCDKDLENTEIALASLRGWTYIIAGLSAVAGFIIGILL